MRLSQGVVYLVCLLARGRRTGGRAKQAARTSNAQKKQTAVGVRAAVSREGLRRGELLHEPKEGTTRTNKQWTHGAADPIVTRARYAEGAPEEHRRVPQSTQPGRCWSCILSSRNDNNNNNNNRIIRWKSENANKDKNNPAPPAAPRWSVFTEGKHQHPCFLPRRRWLDRAARPSARSGCGTQQQKMLRHAVQRALCPFAVLR